MAETMPPGVVNRESIVDRLLGIVGVRIVRADLPASIGESRAFPAGVPMAPVEPRGSEPRAQVPPVMLNAVARPRRFPGIDLTPFDTLRNLARFDLVRIAIEDVKGQILGMGWNIAVRKEHAEEAETFEEDVAEVRRAIEVPDPLAVLDWRAWLGKVVEEILVTDALTLYPRFSRGGDPIGLEQINGATIVPLLDDLGRPPIPPEAAYQQIVHGRPETEFVLPLGEVTTEELWYLPRHRTAAHPYGCSPTEGVLLTVNLAMRHTMHDLAWHTDGNVPDSLYAFTADKTSEQIKEYQEYFDDILTGRQDLRSGNMRMVPPGTYTATKTREWKYDFMEWLGRVIAWSFGVSPLPIAKMVNRATSEMLELSSLESGVKPLADHVASIMNRYISRVLQKPHIEFAWEAKEKDDTATVTERQSKLISVGATTLNEVRKENGADPYTDEDLPEGTVHFGDRPFIVTGAGVQFLDVAAETKPTVAPDDDAASRPVPGDDAEPEPSSGAPSDEDEELAPPSFPTALAAYAGRVRDDLRKWRKVARRGLTKRFTSTCIIDRVRECIEAHEVGKFRSEAISHTITLVKSEPEPTAAFAEVETTFATVVDGWLAGQLAEVTRWALGFLEGRESLIEATEEIPDEAIDKLANRPDTTVVLGRPVGHLRKQFPTEPPINPVSMFDALVQVLLGGYEAGQADTIGAVGVALDTVPADALLFAQERAAEMVGMKWIGGQLVTNPNPEFAISTALRESVKAKVEQAITRGWSPDQLTASLRDDFSDWRARTIARTETGFAYGEGAADVYDEVEVEFVEILDGVGCVPNGHIKGAGIPSGKPGVIEESAQANGQVWTVAQYRAHKLGHPNCVRAAVPFFAEVPSS